MNKKVKITLIGLGSVAVAAAVAVGGFFSAYPMTPNVEIKSAQERIENKGELLIASYNTAAPWGNLIKGTYTTRRAHLFAQQLNDTLPDSFGVQEINSDWVARFEKLLPQYAYYGVKRGGDSDEKTSEMSGIFYLKEKYNLLDSGTFWISNTPETESKFDGAACYRICSFAVLENKTTGFKYVHMNTHLDHVSTEAQNLGGNLILEKAQELEQKYADVKLVITGDFNQSLDGEAVKILSANGFVSANTVAENGDKTATYHGWQGYTEDAPIDFIFADETMKIKLYNVQNEKVGNSFASDHYMITAEIEI